MMESLQQKDNRVHYLHNKERGFDFNPAVVEIALLDQRGLSLWQQARTTEQLHWDGKGRDGKPMLRGSYILKIVYEPKKIIYLPLIIM